MEQQTPQFKFVEDAELVAAFQSDLDAILLKHNVALKPILASDENGILPIVKLIQQVYV